MDGQPTDQVNDVRPEVWHAPLTRVTTLSKYLALVLFVILPILGFWVGYVSAPADTCCDDPSRVTSKYLFASPASGSTPLTVRFHSTYAYPKSYAGGQMLTLDFGDGHNLVFDETVEHTYTTPGTYRVRLLGCNVTVDRFCEQTELDTLTIKVVGDGVMMLESAEGVSNTIPTPNEPAVPNTETGVNTSPISVERCEGQDLNLCFGSGRQLLTETNHATVWSLVSKNGALAYGVIERDTGGMWTIFIK